MTTAPRLRAHGLESLAPETVRRMRVDCANFWLEAGDIADELGVVDVASDFWMERNQRPFDGDYPRTAATELTEVARRFPASELYLDDDDGLIRSR
jgi:hypothetical protein